MKIIYKLSLGFIIVVVLVCLIGYSSIQYSKNALVKSIGESSVIIAQESIDKIDRAIYNRMESMQVYANDQELQSLIMESNKEFDAMENPQAYIDKKDKEWMAVPKETITPFMNRLIHNELFEELKAQGKFYEEKYGYRVFAEIFVTNKYGANAGQTGKTTDYYQADEDWWKEAKKNGLHIGEVSYDKSSDTRAIYIGIRVDDEEGNFAGVIKAVINVREATRIIDEIIPEFKGISEFHEAHGHQRHDTMHIELIKEDGRLIYSTQQHGNKIDTKISEGLLSKINHSGIGGYFWGDGDRAGEAEELYAHAHSRGYHDFDGSGWILLIEHSTEEVFAPAMELKKLLFSIVLVVIIIVLLIGMWVSASISRPIKKLKDGTDKIGKGEMDTIIDIRSTDEISQLARSFNQMTKDLKATTVSRDELLDEIKMRKQSEIMLRDGEERFRSVVESANDAIIYIDSHGEIIFWNSASEIIFGYSGDEIVGKSVTHIIPKAFREAHKKGLDRVVNGGESKIIGKTVELVASRKDGSEFPVELSLSTWATSKGKFFTGIVRNISERKEMEDQLKELSLTDELTGLQNRRGFFHLTDHLLKQANRQKQGMFVLYADLDKLKEINDNLGHKEGDNALIDFAKILKGSYRESDVASRLGGDEFTVIPVGFAGDNVDMIESRLQEKLDAFNAGSNRRYKLSASIGIFYYDPESPCSIDELLAQADKLMYEQKRKKYAANPKPQHSHSI